MNTVVEIGCGLWPGPFVEGASVHYAVDPTLNRLPGGESSPFTPLRTDARNLDFADESVDLVLARNVFGDPELGMSDSEKNLCQALEVAYFQDGEYDKLEVMRTVTHETITTRKFQLTQEAARILVVGRQLVVVEQYTPQIADRFLREAEEFTDKLGFKLERAKLDDVMPASYAVAHDRAETWTLTKV